MYESKVPKKPSKQLVTKTDCPLCDGLQMIPVIVGDEVRAKRCICLERILARKFLGNDEIYYAPKLKSGLYLPEQDAEGNEIGVDRMEDNLFLKGPWSLVCQHLRWCLVLKHHRYPDFTFKLVSDQRVVDVYVGAESYKNKAAKDREYGENNNSLSDLVEEPDLLLLRLGVLGSSNKAAANAVLSVLRIRGDEGKPVWVIEGDRPFGDGHRAYNYELGDYIEDRFDVEDLRADKTQPVAFPVAPAADVETISMGVEDSPPRVEEFDVEPPSQERFKQSSSKKSWSKGKKGRTPLPDMGL